MKKKRVYKKITTSDSPWIWTYYPQEKIGYLAIKGNLGNACVESTTVLLEDRLMLDKGKNGEIIGIEYIG